MRVDGEWDRTIWDVEGVKENEHTQAEWPTAQVDWPITGGLVRKPLFPWLHLFQKKMPYLQQHLQGHVCGSCPPDSMVWRLVTIMGP